MHVLLFLETALPPGGYAKHAKHGRAEGAKFFDLFSPKAKKLHFLDRKWTFQGSCCRENRLFIQKTQKPRGVGVLHVLLFV